MSKENPFAHSFKKEDVHNSVLNAVPGISGVAEALQNGKGMGQDLLEAINAGKQPGKGMQV